MVSIIVAYDLNMAIGRKNNLPWHISQDLKRFKAITKGKTVIMGRKTYESIGKPLPERTNIVLSRQNHFPLPDNVIHMTDYKECVNIKDAFVIGGAEIYNLFLPYATKLFITKIDYIFADTDTFFKWDENQFNLISTVTFQEDYIYSFNEYIKNELK